MLVAQIDSLECSHKLSTDEKLRLLTFCLKGAAHRHIYVTSSQSVRDDYALARNALITWGDGSVYDSRRSFFSTARPPNFSGHDIVDKAVADLKSLFIDAAGFDPDYDEKWMAVVTG